MRVAFTLIGGNQWAGGRNYLRNLLAALAQYEPARVDPVLFVGTDCSDAELTHLRDLPRSIIVRSCEFNAPRRLSSLLASLLWGRDSTIVALFKQHRIDVIFEAAQFFGWRTGLPAIAWFPDFQHRALPELFSAAARVKRELGFRAQVAAGRTIMLSSQDARQQCERYYPQSRGRAFAVPFAVLPTTTVALDQARKIASSHELNEPFFYLPNQFWRHKNHSLAIEALALLRKRGRRVVIAASGHQADPRSPEHFSTLRDRIIHLGLESDFRLLGTIPYDHTGALMQACAAMINPSLFEGWSTTVEEARLLGTPMLLSDLDVHKEQAGGSAKYFDRNSPEALADCLEHFQHVGDAVRQQALERAQIEGQARARAYAAEFANLAFATIKAGTTT